MNITWNTGRPQIDGTYVVCYDTGFITTISFTTEHGWNTTSTCWDYGFPDEEVVAWAESFGKYIVDIYGHRVIMTKGEEG